VGSGSLEAEGQLAADEGEAHAGHWRHGNTEKARRHRRKKKIGGSLFSSLSTCREQCGDGPLETTNRRGESVKKSALGLVAPGERIWDARPQGEQRSGGAMGGLRLKQEKVRV